MLLCLHQSEGRTDVIIWSRGRGLVKGVGTYLYSSLLRLASMLCSSACISLKAALMWQSGQGGRDLSRGWKLTCILLCLDWLVCYAPLFASVWRPHWCNNLVKGVGTCQGGGDLSRGLGPICILLCLDWLVCNAPLLASVWRLHWCDNLVKGVENCQGGGDLSRGWELTCILLCFDWLVCYAPLLASVWKPHWCDNLVRGRGLSRGWWLVQGVGTYLYSSLLRLASMLCSSACISLKAALMWWFSKTALSLYNNATSDLQ